MEKAIQRYWPVFVLPTLLAFIIGFIWPFIWGVALSFCKFTTVQKVTFVGLGNYAKIDGANAKQILFKIKIPMVMPSITICTFLTLTNSFKLFDQNLSLTGGEPAKQTMMLAYNIYDTFYARSGPQWKGIGQAKAVVFCLFVVVLAVLQQKLTQSKEVQQ